MNQAIQNLVMEYLAVPENTNRRNRSIHTNRPPTQHQRQMEFNQLEGVLDLIYYYNRNMNSYQNNMSSVIQLLQSMHQNYHTINYPRESIDISRNATPLRYADISANHSIPLQYTDLSRNTNPYATPMRPTNPFDNTVRYYFFPRGNANQWNPAVGSPVRNEPVTRQLTPIEIDYTTEQFSYSLNENQIIDVRCPISLDDFQEGDSLCRILGCGHVFKYAPIMDWFSRNARCPVCRYNLLEYRRNPSAVSQQNQTPIEQSADLSGTFDSFFENTFPTSEDISANRSSFPLPQNLMNEYQNMTNIIQNELGNEEMMEQIMSMFNDFMQHPTTNRTYAMDASGSGTQYTLDFTLY
jgi:hypothetical protein